MSEYEELATSLRTRLAELIGRAATIEDDLRHPQSRDTEEQATDLTDDQTLAGVDEVLRAEIAAAQAALRRIESGTYGICASCGGDIGQMRLRALPTATLCIDCA